MANYNRLQDVSRFYFDSILLPYNYLMHLNERYRNEFDEVVRICQESNTAVQRIKSIARGPWGITPQKWNTWYQPFEEQEDIDRAVHSVLGRPSIFLNTVGDVKLLPKVLHAASRFQRRPIDKEMDQLVQRNKMSSLFGIGT